MRAGIAGSQAVLVMCFVLWLLWIGWLAWEERRHRRNLNSLALRIHVNGTRGKSGVTRLIAAGLRAGGYRTMAKVTGTEAKIITPDGSERLIDRRGPANIREYLRTVREAVASGADVLVAECMALQPDLQYFCEHRMMRSHIGVITNVRRDHEEIMGSDLTAIAASIGRTVPEQGKLVATPETIALLDAAGKISGGEASIRAVDPGEVSAEDLSGFPFDVEPDNVALALAVCDLAGVERGQALAGMRGSQPDAGNLSVREFRVAGRIIRFIDALAANDPDSTRILWERHVGAGAAASGVLLHSRPDRRLRTRSLCVLLAGLHAGPYLLTGDTAFAAHCLRQQGTPAERIIPVAVPALDSVLEAAARVLKSDEPASYERGLKDASTEAAVTVFAAGNRKGFKV